MMAFSTIKYLDWRNERHTLYTFICFFGEQTRSINSLDSHSLYRTRREKKRKGHMIGLRRPDSEFSEYFIRDICSEDCIYPHTITSLTT